MEWTKTRPTVSGWYWVYVPKLTECFCVDVSANVDDTWLHMAYVETSDWWPEFDKNDVSHWMGPVIKPEAPAGADDVFEEPEVQDDGYRAVKIVWSDGGSPGELPSGRLVCNGSPDEVPAGE